MRRGTAVERTPAFLQGEPAAVATRETLVDAHCLMAY